MNPNFAAFIGATFGTAVGAEKPVPEERNNLAQDVSPG
jgi:hypothetical protein